MAAQVTMLAPPSKQVSPVVPKPVVPKKVAPWISSNIQNAAMRARRFGRPDSDPGANRQGCLSAATKTQALPFDISAHSVQFVASPGQTGKLQSTVPAAIREAFCMVPAFAGCMVMVADQEARRVTILTLWKGNGHRNHCAGNADQLRMILFPYVDHWLRVENHVAHFSMCATPCATPGQESLQGESPVSESDPTVNA
jgi:hypothetical protein